MTHKEVDHLSDINQTNYLDFSLYDIVIATPVQLKNLLKLKRVKNFIPEFLIIDESDQILLNDPSMRRASIEILNHTMRDTEGQMAILVAATLPVKYKNKTSIERLKELFPNLMEISTGDHNSVPEQIRHNVINVQNKTILERIDLVLSIHGDSMIDKLLIFVQSRETMILVGQILSENKIDFICLLKEDSEGQRIEGYVRFRKGKTRILVTTDSAARGLHFGYNIHVIQFEVSTNIVSMIHRFGRTGRLGTKGVVTSLIEDKDQNIMNLMERLRKGELSYDQVFSRKRSLSKNNNSDL